MKVGCRVPPHHYYPLIQRSVHPCSKKPHVFFAFVTCRWNGLLRQTLNWWAGSGTSTLLRLRPSEDAHLPVLYPAPAPDQRAGAQVAVLAAAEAPHNRLQVQKACPYGLIRNFWLLGLFSWVVVWPCAHFQGWRGTWHRNTCRSKLRASITCAGTPGNKDHKDQQERKNSDDGKWFEG